MSRTSKLTLMGTSLFAFSTIVIVHFQQKAEKAVCYSPSPPSPPLARSSETKHRGQNRRCTRA